MLARIFRPSKTAMQSGRAKTNEWVLEFEPKDARRPDPLMGWTQTSDTESSQVRLTFEAKEDAVRYAEQHGIAFQLVDPKPAKRIIKAYADNFAFGRRIPLDALTRSTS
ncbi:ETC complex I subunit [Phenylobacterium sp. J426]|nr:ETC complex I subunit [Phenylobacterium sp. J426]MCR5875731.1 ETC complex I subunit [Phenylobacterium sp. J426]